MLESNLVASFGTDGKSPVMLSEDAKYDDGVVQVGKLECCLLNVMGAFCGSKDGYFLFGKFFTHLQEAVIEKFVKYYKAIFHHNSWYFANFVMCELLNFILLFAQFQMTDNFLSKKFRWWVEQKLGPCVRFS